MVKLVSLKCPECGANINIESDRKECFCQYCGTKILIDDGNTTTTYRDEARIKEAEVKEQIRLKELELEKEECFNKQKTFKIKIIISIVLGILATVLLIIDSLSLPGIFAIMAILYIWINDFYQNDNNKKKK